MAERKWRLVERDWVVAEWVTGVYVVTDDNPIDGGSHWAVVARETSLLRTEQTGEITSGVA